MGKKESPAEKTFQKKREALVARTASIMQITEQEADQRLRIPLVHSLRINPLLGDPAEILQTLGNLGWVGRPVEWCEHGYTIEQGYEQIKDCELVQSGQIYVQNQSSWLPVIALEVQPTDHVLDLCAAPGGKTSHMAAIMSNGGRIVAYDTNRGRYIKLQQNLKRLGVTNAECKLTDSSSARAGTAGVFDKILLDAPCGGEGLVNLDNKAALDTWSVAHIRRLATLQKQLILQAWSMLKPGGTLVYSTCTMAPEENEAVIEYLVRKCPGVEPQDLPVPVEPIIKGWNDRDFPGQVAKAGRVFPSQGQEAFFVSKFRKAVPKAKKAN